MAKTLFLATGEFWIDLFDKPTSNGPEIFATWLALTNNSFPNAIEVEVTEDDPDSSPPSQWIKFRVNISVPWSIAEFVGNPTRIKEGQKINSKADTSTANNAKEEIDKEAKDNFRDLTSALKTGMYVVGGGLLVYGIAKLLK